jgi:hypothetical protein
MAALQYLERQRAAQPELAEWYTSMADLYERKLWHQLTQKLEQFVALAVFQVTRPLRLFGWPSLPAVYSLLTSSNKFLS